MIVTSSAGAALTICMLVCCSLVSVAQAKRECNSDSECTHNQYCKSDDGTCRPACSLCSTDATCERVENHRPVCHCINGKIQGGDCLPLCKENIDCGRDKPTCSDGKCVNNCDVPGICGRGAQCRVKDNGTPVCSCPRGTTGDPFKECHTVTEAEVCTKNPCGENAICKPGMRMGELIPICSCQPGFLGNALVKCVRGECLTDNDCIDAEGCYGYKCVNVCHSAPCGQNAQCHPKRHQAVCQCSPGFVGNALTGCTRG